MSMPVHSPAPPAPAGSGAVPPLAPTNGDAPPDGTFAALVASLVTPLASPPAEDGSTPVPDAATTDHTDERSVDTATAPLQAIPLDPGGGTVLRLHPGERRAVQTGLDSGPGTIEPGLDLPHGEPPVSTIDPSTPASLPTELGGSPQPAPGTDVAALGAGQPESSSLALSTSRGPWGAAAPRGTLAPAPDASTATSTWTGTEGVAGTPGAAQASSSNGPVARTIDTPPTTPTPHEVSPTAPSPSPESDVGAHEPTPRQPDALTERSATSALPPRGGGSEARTLVTSESRAPSGDTVGLPHTTSRPHSGDAGARPNPGVTALSESSRRSGESATGHGGGTEVDAQLDPSVPTGPAPEGGDRGGAAASSGTVINRPGAPGGPAPSAPASSTPVRELALTATRLVEEMQRASETHRRMIVRLDPPELGTLTLELTSIADELTVAARTESHEAARALLRQRNEIHVALEALGMSLSEFDVKSKGHDGRERWSGPRHGGDRRGTPETGHEPGPPADQEGVMFL